ncbi:hypothetical protein IEQ34_006333 [Dendrobium chrysotoxum]|uniref:Uncharacterized protein n=1 Tax=Dendrobium chrysotoxum TaxID=161865 RepID=A0AAV7GWH9_DENCH|nr:hypothetical protein IEQ34_006333 [Dendrobium chrysotoxum]
MEDVKKSTKPDCNTSDFTSFSFRPTPAVKEIYAADKLFHRGKLLPCKPITPPPPSGAGQRKKISSLRLRLAESPNSPDRWRYREADAGEYRRLRMASPDLTPEAVGGKQSKRLPCMLGVVRLPVEMEMKDIKTRQRRLGQPPQAAENGRRGFLYWGILQSLSCKAAESTAVAPVNAPK